MKQEYMDAFAEVDEIFKLMPITLLNKIPINFRNVISSEKTIGYKTNISETFQEQDLKEETIIILGLIYREFLCSDEERKKLKIQDTEKIKEAEQELRKKYNTDDIFKNRKQLKEGNLEKNENNIKVIQKEKWYKKIFNVIKRLIEKK